MCRPLRVGPCVLTLTLALAGCGPGPTGPESPPRASFLPQLGGHWRASLLEGRFEHPSMGAVSCSVADLDLYLVQERPLDGPGLRASKLSGHHEAADFVCVGDDHGPLPAPFDAAPVLHLPRRAVTGAVMGYCQGAAIPPDGCDRELDVVIRVELVWQGYTIVLLASPSEGDRLVGSFRMVQGGYSARTVLRGALQAKR